MKTKLLSLALVGILSAGAAQAATFVIDFDALADGAAANTDAVAAINGIAFQPGIYDFDYDGFGDPIPGTEHWQIDPLGPALQATNITANFPGWGAAPSGLNMLNTDPNTVQPTIIVFGGPAVSFDAFSVTLDNSTLGPLIPAAVEFYSSANTLLASVPVDASISGFLAAQGPLTGVGYIVLPSVAFYDNVSFTNYAVPEPSRAMLLAAGLGLGVMRRRRK